MNAVWSLGSNDNNFGKPTEKAKDLSRKSTQEDEYNHVTTINGKNSLKWAICKHTDSSD